MKEVNTVEQTGTVAAIATPNAAGGIGIVRISGGDAIAVADKVFSAVSGKPLSEAAGYTAAHSITRPKMWHANTARTMSASIRAAYVNVPAWRSGSRQVCWS